MAKAEILSKYLCRGDGEIRAAKGGWRAQRLVISLHSNITVKRKNSPTVSKRKWWISSDKINTLERGNTALHREVTGHEKTIEALQTRIQTMQADHSREIREMWQKHVREIGDKGTKHKEEISFLKTIIVKATAWFLYLREMLRMEKLCRLVGFDERQITTLVSVNLLEYAGELYSEEHRRKFTTEKAEE